MKIGSLVVFFARGDQRGQFLACLGSILLFFYYSGIFSNFSMLIFVV